jgi:hypothetical protein
MSLSPDDEVEKAFFIGMQKIDNAIVELEEMISAGADQEEIDFYYDELGLKTSRLAKRWDTLQYIL